jgi:hypothetical protein
MYFRRKNKNLLIKILKRENPAQLNQKLKETSVNGMVKQVLSQGMYYHKTAHYVTRFIRGPFVPALQMQCTENSKQIFPEMKLRGLVPNFYIHVSVSDLYIPTIGPQQQYRKKGGPIVRIQYISLTDT